MKRIELLSITVNAGDFNSFLSAISYFASSRISSYTCVANVHMLVEAQLDGSFADIVKGADIVTPDGIPLCWSLKLLYGISQERIAGMDLLPEVLKLAVNKRISVYFYGGTEETLRKSDQYLKQKFPDLVVAGMYSPPFRLLNKTEEEDIVNKINNSGAGIVFVVLGCPKQEKWMAAMKGRINAMMIGVGGAVNVVVGIHKRAPSWMQKSGLEWLFRLIQEPGRLFKRYAVTNSIFLLMLVREFVKIKIFKRNLSGKQP